MKAIMAGALLAVLATSRGAAKPTPAIPDGEGYLALHFSDGTAPALGVEAVNDRLRAIGVRVSEVPIPETVKPILIASRTRAVTGEESELLLEHFHLRRRELVDEIVRAGRKPEMHRGGYLRTSENGVPPYPKVYDMKALDRKTTAYLQEKFGKLHVNSSDAGVGIDEVMTIVSGGPYTWFFVFDGGVVGKLRFGSVSGDGNSWRISYPGLVPHGGFFDAEHGLVIAFAHGPKHFVMRYEDPSVDGFETLNDNPWIDFRSSPPRLLERPKSASTSVSANAVGIGPVILRN
jgi:hypothetical protein